MAIEPDEAMFAELAAIADSPDDGEFVMLNLNQYRDRDRYQRYAAVAAQVLADVGGSIAWYTPGDRTVVGEPGERWDEVIAVRYPSVSAFLKLASDPRLLEVRDERAAGLERATLVRCTHAPAPV
jgi:uncharacterized protein (DUF1330 family)